MLGARRLNLLAQGNKSRVQCSVNAMRPLLTRVRHWWFVFADQDSELVMSGAQPSL